MLDNFALNLVMSVEDVKNSKQATSGYIVIRPVEKLGRSGQCFQSYYLTFAILPRYYIFGEKRRRNIL